MKEFGIDKHGKQPTGRKEAKIESHHVESQTRLKRSVANYSADKDPTVLLDKQRHAQLTKEQMGDMREPNHNAELGTSEAIARAAELLTNQGTPETIANAAVLEHDGYLKGTSPLTDEKHPERTAKAAIEAYNATEPADTPNSLPGETFAEDSHSHAQAEWSGTSSTEVKSAPEAASKPGGPDAAPREGNASAAKPKTPSFNGSSNKTTSAAASKTRGASAGKPQTPAFGDGAKQVAAAKTNASTTGATTPNAPTSAAGKATSSNPTATPKPFTGPKLTP